MPAEPGRLAETLDAFPRDVWVTVEPRHESWFSDEVRAILREREAALCLADRRGRRTPVDPAWATAPWGYVRFHDAAAFAVLAARAGLDVTRAPEPRAMSVG
jgi:uncharacterized protein YecE (DUF72 family)